MDRSSIKDNPLISEVSEIVPGVDRGGTSQDVLFASGSKTSRQNEYNSSTSKVLWILNNNFS
ncbi:hypothetical protein SK128_023333, partial [Halocaridina rubra]